jgi:hypothetical protein
MSEAQDISPFKALDFMRDKAHEFGQKKGYMIFMQEKRKTVKAMLMASSSEKTESAKETYAYSHDDYKTHLAELRDAVADYETLRIQMSAAEAKIEVWRSLESSARAEGRATQ